LIWRHKVRVGRINIGSQKFGERAMSKEMMGAGAMSKPTYKVWVINQIPLGTTVYDSPRGSYYFVWDQSTLNDTVAELKRLFDEVCKNPQSKFGDTDVDASKDINTVGTLIKPGELIVRLTTKANSILIKKYGKSSVSGEAEGATIDTGSGVVSEAWLEGAAGDSHVALLVARLAFHELMHNKIDATMTTKDIHGTDDGTGIAATPVAYDSQLTSKNKLNMASRLGSIVTQFTGATIP
jgi:hypothetical protein